MPVKIEVKDTVMSVFLDGEIDHHTAAAIRAEADAAIDAELPEVVILDFRDVTFMDSSGIGLVMGRYRKLKELPHPCELHITGTSPSIYKVMHLAGLERLAKIDKGR
ncbi:MAG: anti-sigma factor antagonist [Candidatus Howiella sp.]